MVENIRQQFKQALAALDWFIVNENTRHQHDPSVDPIPRQRIKIGGDAARLLAERPSKATAGMTVEVVGEPDNRVRQRLSDLLLESGFRLETSRDQTPVTETASWSKFFDSPRLEVEIARFVDEEEEAQYEPSLEKVLQRLNFEKILLTPGITPRRTRVTLRDLIDAGKSERRIYEVVPAILLYKPQMILRLERDIRKFPELDKIPRDFPRTKKRGLFFGVEWGACVKAAQTFKTYLDQRRARQKSTMMTLRLSPAELDMLRRLKQKLGARSVSEAMLQVARERLLGPS